MKQMRLTAAIAALLLAVSACASDTLPPDDATPPVLVTSEPTAVPASGIESSLCNRVDGPGCVFDHGNFDHPTLIDNEWLPMIPGTRLVFEGTTNEENELLEHQVIITVTDLTKVIDGINSVISWDQDFSEGELVEAELAFFAQDNDGNVWRMGEHPEEYEHGVLIDAPTWMAGVNGALAGISMLADPIVGTLSYSQGWSVDVEFFDRGKVNRFGEETCVALDCFENTLVIEEFDVEEISGRQLKYFARGVGNILVDWSGDDETQEELELVAVEHLDASGLAEARAAVFELDRHARQVSPDVYGSPNAGEIRSP
jgi:hypothetical protein